MNQPLGEMFKGLPLVLRADWSLGELSKMSAKLTPSYYFLFFLLVL
jgi:hypothetical protein